MAKYSVEEIARILETEAVIRQGGTIRWLLTDSRSMFYPEESLFFALKTQRNDGHRYVADLYRRGMRHFVVSDHLITRASFPEADILYVDDTLKALQRLAAYHRSRFSCPVIAITGSNGKTIVKEWLWQLLRENVRIERSPRSYNSQIGVPLSVWELDEKTELGIFEAGISEPGEMERLEAIIRPDWGILTNI
jgi:alanine racemase